MLDRCLLACLLWRLFKVIELVFVDCSKNQLRFLEPIQFALFGANLKIEIAGVVCTEK